MDAEVIPAVRLSRELRNGSWTAVVHIEPSRVVAGPDGRMEVEIGPLEVQWLLQDAARYVGSLVVDVTPEPHP